MSKYQHFVNKFLQNGKSVSTVQVSYINLDGAIFIIMI